MPIHYVPPTPEGLLEQKRRRGATSAQMAQVYGLAGDNQYRKYVGGKEPRPMSLPMLFLAMAVENRHATVEEVFDICRRETGAVIDLDTAGESELSQG